MAYHYLWLEAMHVGPLDRELVARRTGALAGGTDHPWNSDQEFQNRAAGHCCNRAGGYHHWTYSSFYRLSDHLSHAGPVPPRLECDPFEAGVHVYTRLPDRRFP